MAVFPDDPGDVGATDANKKRHLLRILGFRHDHLIGIFDELAQGVSKKFLHGGIGVAAFQFVAGSDCNGSFGGFFGFVDNATDGLRGLRPDTDPVVGTIEGDVEVFAFFLRIVGPDDLDEFPVTWTAFVSDDDFIIRVVAGTFAFEADCYGHDMVWGVAEFLGRLKAVSGVVG